MNILQAGAFAFLLSAGIEQVAIAGPCAKKICDQVRCPVCDGQSVMDSEATLAQDLRRLVHEQISQGKSESEVLDFLVERYGEGILLKPRMSWDTVALWGFPLGLVLALGSGLYWRRRLFFSI